MAAGGRRHARAVLCAGPRAQTVHWPTVGHARIDADRELDPERKPVLKSRYPSAGSGWQRRACEILTADARDVPRFCGLAPRINARLVDAPCTAFGIGRRENTQYHGCVANRMLRITTLSRCAGRPVSRLLAPAGRIALRLSVGFSRGGIREQADSVSASRTPPGRLDWLAARPRTLAATASLRAPIRVEPRQTVGAADRA